MASQTPVLAVLGAGPKAMAVAAKAKVLRDLGLGTLDVIIIEEQAVAADWLGKFGWTNGEPILSTPPEKDIGFPYRSLYGPQVDRALWAYAWPRFLVESQGYADWVDRGRPRPHHAEWAAYLRWVFAQTEARLVPARLVQVCPVEGGLALTLRGEPAPTLAADGLVITGPGEPLRLPGVVCDNQDCILDGRTYWLKREQYATLPAGRVAVIGGGETAASIAVSLLANPGLAIEIISRRGMVYTRGESYYENRLYSHPDTWRQLSEADREEFIERTDRGVFSVAAQQELGAAPNVRLRPGQVLGAVARGGKAQLILEWDGVRNELAYDRVIVAIGYDPYSPLELLPTAQRPSLPADELRRRVDGHLCIPGLPLHMPMIAGLAQGPGFPNLSCLGTLSDRILSRYLPPEPGR
jgi:mycobactin lysine-N-oxygenase